MRCSRRSVRPRRRTATRFGGARRRGTRPLRRRNYSMLDAVGAMPADIRLDGQNVRIARLELFGAAVAGPLGLITGSGGRRESDFRQLLPRAQRRALEPETRFAALRQFRARMTSVATSRNGISTTPTIAALRLPEPQLHRFDCHHLLTLASRTTHCALVKPWSTCWRARMHPRRPILWRFIAERGRVTGPRALAITRWRRRPALRPVQREIYVVCLTPPALPRDLVAERFPPILAMLH